MGNFREKLDTILTSSPVAVIYRVGNLGSLAASIFRKEGRRDVFNVIGYEGMVKCWIPNNCFLAIFINCLEKS